jgi:hypothetical protein
MNGLELFQRGADAQRQVNWRLHCTAMAELGHQSGIEVAMGVGKHENGAVLEN